MNLSNYFKKDLIFSNMEADAKEEYFQTVANKALDLEMVTDEFKENVIKRESTFPTGIQLKTYGIAIPHTDAQYVKDEFIAVTTFKEPVEFSSMEDMNAKVDVKIAFMLGLNQPHAQLEVLQELMGLFQNEEMLEELLEAKSSEELQGLLSAL